MSTTRDLCLVSASGLLLLAGCATVQCPAEGGRDWREITTRHFQLSTDLDADHARSAAVRLERVRHVLLAAMGINVDPPGRLAVVAFAGTKVFDLYQGERDGMLVFSPDQVSLVVTSRGLPRNAEIRRTSVFAHELSHFLTYSLFGDVPLWLNEGLAQHFGALRLDTDGQSAYLGHEDPEALALLQREHSLVSLDALWQWKPADQREDMRDVRHYASSWFWVSYLMRKEQRRFEDFLSRMAKGEKARPAFDAAFPGQLLEQLDSAVGREYRHWFQDFPVRTLAIPSDCCAPVAERVMKWAEYHVLLGDLSRFSWWGKEHAGRRDAEYAEALAHDPLALAPNLSRLPALSPTAQVALCRKLTQAHPDSAYAWAALASALVTTAAAQPEIDEAQSHTSRLAAADGMFNARLARAYMDNRSYAEGVAAGVKDARPDAVLLTEGKLRRELIRQAIVARLDELRPCHERVAGSEATIVARFVVAPSGKLQTVEVINDQTSAESALVECVLGYVRAWTFPAAVVSTVSLTYAFSFKPTDP